MNVGYTKSSDLNNSVNDDVCPICGSNIYISKHYDDYFCVDENCPLVHGAKLLICKINTILDKM